MNSFKDYDMCKVAIIGSTGYTGFELIKLLLRHSEVEITYLGSKNYAGQKISSIFQGLLNIIDLELEDLELEEIAKRADIIFCATPHGYLAKTLESKILDRVKIIDLSADFRFSNFDIYKQWYKQAHLSPNLQGKAVYGLPEINREKIKNARLIANPGCYATCSILSLYPLIKEKALNFSSIIIDAKSGVSGAGRELKNDNLFCEVNDNFKAYALHSHRHTPEILDKLNLFPNEKISLTFTPHLVPMSRGILCTIYADTKLDENEISLIYKKYYSKEGFIRLLPPLNFPQTRWVKHSNLVDISFSVNKKANKIIIVSAIDNLLRGASGQAVMNMNILCGFKEDHGLDLIPTF